MQRVLRVADLTSDEDAENAARVIQWLAERLLD
jgi:hypothetical protein